MEFNYKNILEDKELIRIFKNNYYERVYDLLGKFVLKYNLSKENRKELQNKLFIEYLKYTSLKRKDNHVYY